MSKNEVEQYYGESVHKVNDLAPFIELTTELSEMATEGRINDMRRRLVNFTVAYAERQSLLARLDEVRNLHELRKLYDEYELKGTRDLSGDKIATWQGYKFFRNPISDRIEQITGMRHEQGIEEWLTAQLNTLEKGE